MPRYASFALLVLSAALPALGQPVAVPNHSFEDGADSPTGWSLSGGTGKWETTAHDGARSISLTGDGTDTNSWTCDELRFEPSTLYRISFSLRWEGSGGCAITGPTSNNRDFRPGEDWQRRSFVFRTPDDTANVRLRFGHWNHNGTVWFDDVELVKVMPVHRQKGALVLGVGEELREGTYTFESQFGEVGSNYSRTLVGSAAGFNSHRYALGQGASVTYRYGLPGYRIRSAAVRCNVGYYQSGRCLVEASRDGEQFTPLGGIAAVEEAEFPVPAELLPAAELYVRFRADTKVAREGDSNPGSFQIYRHSFSAEVDGPACEVVGDTQYAEVLTASPLVAVDIRSVGRLLPGKGNEVALSIEPQGGPGRVLTELSVGPEGAAVTTRQDVQLRRGANDVSIPYDVTQTGAQQMELRVVQEATGGELFAARIGFDVPSLYASDYGYLVKSDADWELWWCEGTYKVSRERPAPEVTRRTVEIEAARNEYEPVQVVLRPKRALSGLRAELSPLVGPNGARIKGADVSVCRVAYLNVAHPTDDVGCKGWWPDPLPPLRAPLDIAAGENQPLWVTVRLPEDAPAGDYVGALALTAEGCSARIPLRLHVWDFTLPKETHLKSAFGLSTGLIRQYHGLETTEELREVLDKYYRNFAEHRIAPYDPMSLDPIQVDFGMLWEGGKTTREEKLAGERSLQLVDDSETSSPSATYGKTIPIDPAKPYTARWSARTATEGSACMLTFNNYDAQGQWISGRNIDLVRNGTGKWETYEEDLTGRFPKQAASTRAILRPASWRDDGSTTGTAWFDEVSLRQGDNGPNLIVGGDFEFEPSQERAKLDWTRFDQAAAKYLDGFGFNSFRLRLEGMGGGTFHSRSQGRIGSYERGTPEYDRLFGDYVKRVQDHLAKKGWLDKAYLYWFDEPDPKDYAFVREGMETVHRFAPGIQRMLTEQPEEELFGAVDIWCPVLGAYDPKICQARQREGEHLWWYVCTGPKGDYTTLFIDHPAVNMRMWLWQTWKWNVEAILVWTTTHWTSNCAFVPPARQNPYEDPMGYVQGYSRPPGFVGYWGNGDGRFVYPPEKCFDEGNPKVLDGPVNAFRWEMLREGIEDYEYFHLLRSLIEQARGTRRANTEAFRRAEALLTVPESICSTFTDFTRDPQPMYEHRRKVAAAIEWLSR